MTWEGWDRPSAWGILGAELWFEVEGVSQPALLALYAPYCGGLSAEDELGTALTILQSQLFEGCRPVQDSPGHAYLLSWDGGQAPLERISCCLSFPGLPERQYRFELLTHQLVSWLMQVNHPNDPKADLPDEFWHWLLIGSDPADDST